MALSAHRSVHLCKSPHTPFKKTRRIVKWCVPILWNSASGTWLLYHSGPMTLKEILGLVGKLDDTIGDDTPRERFRKHLGTAITTVGVLRDYVEICLKDP